MLEAGPTNRRLRRERLSRCYDWWALSDSNTERVQFLRLRTVSRMTGLARSTILRMIAKNDYPAPVRLATRIENAQLVLGHADVLPICVSARRSASAQGRHVSRSAHLCRRLVDLPRVQDELERIELLVLLHQLEIHQALGRTQGIAGR